MGISVPEDEPVSDYIDGDTVVCILKDGTMIQIPVFDVERPN